MLGDLKKKKSKETAISKMLDIFYYRMTITDSRVNVLVYLQSRCMHIFHFICTLTKSVHPVGYLKLHFTAVYHRPKSFKYEILLIGERKNVNFGSFAPTQADT